MKKKMGRPALPEEFKEVRQTVLLSNEQAEFYRKYHRHDDTGRVATGIRLVADHGLKLQKQNS